MSQTLNNSNEGLRWPEILSLAGLNAAIVISWIAYHEYQPVLIDRFEFNDLSDFLVLVKAIVLVAIPPLAGWVADLILRKNGKYFTVFSVGIGATAMIFMAVASIIGAGPLSAIRGFLPFMIILWLIAMNLFISPANSMIESFGPARKLPIVMGVLFLTTEIIYALEPVVISLVQFFGDTLTFIVGALLVGGTGFLFQKVSSDEVVERKKELLSEKNKSTTALGFLSIVIIGLVLGLGKALLVEYLPNLLNGQYQSQAAQFISLGLLGFAAIFGFAISGLISKLDLTKVIIFGFIFTLFGAAMVILKLNFTVTIIGSVITAIAFSTLNISGLPFAFKHLSARNITYGVGIYIGASEIFGGIIENLNA